MDWRLVAGFLVVAWLAACSGGDEGVPGGTAGSVGSGGDPRGNAGEVGEVGESGAGESAAGGTPSTEGGTNPGGGSKPNGGSAGSGATPIGGDGTTAGGEGGTPSEPVPGEVTGEVSWRGLPLADLAVVLDGRTTLTDAQGRFTFEGVGASYQLTIISARMKAALVLDGMTGRAPHVVFPARSQPLYFTSVSGFARSSTYDAPTWRTRVFFISDDQQAMAIGDFASLTDEFEVAPFWYGGRSVHGKLWALVYSASNAARQWPVMASKALTLTQGKPIEPKYPEPQGSAGQGGDGGEGSGGPSQPPTSEADLTFEPVPGQRSLKCAVQGPPGWELQVDLLVGAAPFAMAKLGESSYDCTVPVGTGLPVAVRVAAFDPSSLQDYTAVTKAVPVTGDMSLVVEPGAKRVLPFRNASGITTQTEFSFTAPPTGSVVRVTFSLGGWEIHRVTPERKTTLPDLTGYGVPIPKNAAGSWVVSARGPATTVDEAAALPTPSPEEPGIVEGLWSYSDAEFGAFPFTTAP